jgi:hypothetical protein
MSDEFKGLQHDVRDLNVNIKSLLSRMASMSIPAISVPNKFEGFGVGW